MAVLLEEILRLKVLDDVSTMELFQRFPGYERLVSLVAMSELPELSLVKVVTDGQLLEELRLIRGRRNVLRSQ